MATTEKVAACPTTTDWGFGCAVMEGAGLGGFGDVVPELVAPVHPDRVRATNKADTNIVEMGG